MLPKNAAERLLDGNSRYLAATTLTRAAELLTGKTTKIGYVSDARGGTFCDYVLECDQPQRLRSIFVVFTFLVPAAIVLVFIIVFAVTTTMFIFAVLVVLSLKSTV